MRIRQNLYGPADNGPSFEQMVSQNENKILNLIYGMTGDYHLAQDLTQEVFVKAFQAREGFEGKAKLSTWLYRIAVNATIDHQRKACTRKENPVEDVENGIRSDTCPDPDSACQKTAVKDLLYKAIANLPDQQREVYVLREINGCTTKEVAEVLDCSTELVKWRLHKARSLLRKALQADNKYKEAGTFTMNSTGLE